MKDKILEIIIKYKQEITENNIVEYLGTATDIDKIEETFLEYRPSILKMFFK